MLKFLTCLEVEDYTTEGSLHPFLSVTGHYHSQDSKNPVLAPNMHYLDCISWRLQKKETQRASETKDVCTQDLEFD